jgi:hypothetical protein
MKFKRGEPQPYSMVIGTSAPPPLLDKLDKHSITRDLLNPCTGIRQPASCDLLSLAKSGKNVISENLCRAMRANCDLLTRNNIIEAIFEAAKQGHDITDCLGALSVGFKSGDSTIRNNSLLALAYHAERGRDIFLQLGVLSDGLKDDSPANREAAVRAMKAYASHGKEEAHNVLMKLNCHDDVWTHDIRMRCMEILRG